MRKLTKTWEKTEMRKKKFDGLHHLPYLLAEFVVDEVPNIDVNARNIKEFT